MRTRLDEIVEHDHNLDLRGLKDSDRVAVSVGALKCSHERAFRHGVERGEEFLRLTIQNLLKMDSDVLTRGAERVQPAPAVEKLACGCPEKVNCFCYLDRREEKKHVHERGFPCATCGYPFDRRKGERRTSIKINRSFVWQRPEDGKSFGTIFEDPDADCWKWDRRSGKDRRK